MIYLVHQVILGITRTIKICNNVKKILGKGENVVLMHDYSGKTSSITSLECIIDYGLNNGYEFSKITKDTKEVHHYVAN